MGREGGVKKGIHEGKAKTKCYLRAHMETYSRRFLKLYAHMKEIQMESTNNKGDKASSRYPSPHHQMKLPVSGMGYN